MVLICVCRWHNSAKSKNQWSTRTFRQVFSILWRTRNTNERRQDIYLVSDHGNRTEEHLILNHWFVYPNSSMKHLWFLWSIKKNNTATVEVENISQRVNKFWVVVYSLIKFGIRYCAPHTIAQLFRSLATSNHNCSQSKTERQDLHWNLYSMCLDIAKTIFNLCSTLKAFFEHSKWTNLVSSHVYSRMKSLAKFF